VVDPPPTLEPDLGNASGGKLSSFVVVLGGSPPDTRVGPLLPRERFVIAADSGLDYCRALGLDADLVVGDLDSVNQAALEAATQAGISIERHPSEKDATDAELALDAAVKRGARQVVVVTGGGDRLDHVLAGLFVLGGPAFSTVDVEAWVGTAHVHCLHGPGRVELTGTAGDYVSLVPVHGTAAGVTTSGLKYPLDDEPLLPGSTRGISNEFSGGPATVSLRDGSLFVVIPYALGGHQ
jgi:thiamine pyrophosphokinase